MALTNANAFANNPYYVPSVTTPAKAIQPQCNLYWVNSQEDVLNHPTSPNEQLYFGDRNEPVIYVRETDSNSVIKNPLHVLKYSMEDVAFGPEANFVTKEEHQKLYDLVSQMNEKLEKLLN